VLSETCASVFCNIVFGVSYSYHILQASFAWELPLLVYAVCQRWHSWRQYHPHDVSHDACVSK
jgi:hypothetical protein